VGFVVGSLWLLGRQEHGAPLRFSWWTGIGGALGLLVAQSTFVVDYRVALAGQEPSTFHWGWFGAGLTITAAAVVGAARRTPAPEASDGRP
jgi:hypothetical protein